MSYSRKEYRQENNRENDTENKQDITSPFPSTLLVSVRPHEFRGCLPRLLTSYIHVLFDVVLRLASPAPGIAYQLEFPVRRQSLQDRGRFR